MLRLEPKKTMFDEKSAFTIKYRLTGLIKFSPYLLLIEKQILAFDDELFNACWIYAFDITKTVPEYL